MLLARARNLRLEVGGPSDAEAAHIAALLADLELNADRPERAQTLASDALAALREELPEEDERIVALRLALGRAYAALDLYPLAERELRAAHWLSRDSNPERATSAAESLLQLFEDWEQPERAAEFQAQLDGSSE